jgi:hypothetical protein
VVVTQYRDLKSKSVTIFISHSKVSWIVAYPSRLDIELGACESKFDEREPLCPVLGTRTFGKRQVDPTCDEATIEVAMSNNYDISGSLTLLSPLPMIFTNLSSAQYHHGHRIGLGNALGE